MKPFIIVLCIVLSMLATGHAVREEWSRRREQRKLDFREGYGVSGAPDVYRRLSKKKSEKSEKSKKTEKGGKYKKHG
jgi:hypothetical protein